MRYREDMQMREKLDVLNRQEFIDTLLQLVGGLADKQQGCCFGIEGVWGSGKSFVIEKFEEQLKDIQSEETCDNKYFVFHYDCWKYDYYDEPAIAIIAAMLDATNRELSLFSEGIENAGKLALETVKETLTSIAGELCKNKIGINLVEIASDILEKHDSEGTENFDSLYGFKRALEETRNGIQEIASHKTVIIVVDELDRCLPMYSIKVLERLHHICDELNNVIVIVSMDKRQLEHSIKAIYGEIDVDTYLRKFISFKVGLNTGKASRYAEKFQEYFLMFDMTAEEREDVENFLSDILKGLDMRTQERIFNKARVMHIIAKSDDVRDCSIMTFEILYLTVSLKMKSKNLCWLSKVWTSTFVNEREKLGHAYYEMLNEYGKRVCGPHFTNGIRIINDTVIGRTFFWLSILYKNIEKQPFILYPQATSAATKLVEQFAEIIDIIDVD